MQRFFFLLAVVPCYIHIYSHTQSIAAVMDITKILLLGRGMVARPCVDRNSKNEGTIGELPLPLEWYNLLMTDVRHYYSLTTAQALASSLPRTNAISLDVSSTLNSDSAIAVHDLVISLVPHIYHAEIIKLAIKNKVNVITTSYVSPAIRNLDESAKEVGIVVLNEVGVDPGVVISMQSIPSVKCMPTAERYFPLGHTLHYHMKEPINLQQVTEFHSYCGGLPALECSNNPLTAQLRIVHTRWKASRYCC